MPKVEADLQFIAIRSMFLAGTVSKMRDIEKLYPTRMAKALGTNHSRYIRKLYKPQGFTAQQIMNFAAVVGIDATSVFEVIKKQLLVSPKSKPLKKG